MRLEYRRRPAKAIQRAMVVDGLRRLTAVAPLAKYQYVGFGALEFADFEVIHRALGITLMSSIERDTSGEARYKFNRPFAGINLLMGEARNMLPTIDWSPLSIVWLDYTEQLHSGILNDVDYVGRSLRPGSVLLVTTNAEPVRPMSDRLTTLAEQVGERVPAGLTNDALGGWGLATAQAAVLRAVVNRATAEAHGGGIEQLFNFHYSDGARMLTWGGVVNTPGIERAIEACRFPDLEFFRSNDEAFRIAVPVLTEREVLRLEEQLPAAPGTKIKVDGIDAREIADFASIYRWHVVAR